jgi:hypothetical protein
MYILCPCGIFLAFQKLEKFEDTLLVDLRSCKGPSQQV